MINKSNNYGLLNNVDSIVPNKVNSNNYNINHNRNTKEEQQGKLQTPGTSGRTKNDSDNMNINNKANIRPTNIFNVLGSKKKPINLLKPVLLEQNKKNDETLKKYVTVDYKY